MPQPCPLCHHKEREALARDLPTLPYRQISAKSSVRIATISAHVNTHLPAQWSRIVQSERILATGQTVRRVGARAARLAQVASRRRMETGKNAVLQVLQARI